MSGTPREAPLDALTKSAEQLIIRWVNAHLSETDTTVVSLSDFKEGTKLLFLLQHLFGPSPGSLSASTSSTASPMRSSGPDGPGYLTSSRTDFRSSSGGRDRHKRTGSLLGGTTFHNLEVLNEAFSLAQEAGVVFKFIAPEDFIKGNVKLMLAFLFAVALRFNVRGLSASGAGAGGSSSEEEEEESAKPKMSGQEALVCWVNSRVAQQPYAITVSNFGDSWSDGRAFLALLHSANPQLFRWEDIPPAGDPRISPESNLVTAFKHAQTLLGLPPLLVASDVDPRRPNVQGIITYVSEVFRRVTELEAKSKEEQERKKREAEEEERKRKEEERKTAEADEAERRRRKAERREKKKRQKEVEEEKEKAKYRTMQATELEMATLRRELETMRSKVRELEIELKIARTLPVTAATAGSEEESSDDEQERIETEEETALQKIAETHTAEQKKIMKIGEQLRRAIERVEELAETAKDDTEAIESLPEELSWLLDVIASKGREAASSTAAMAQLEMQLSTTSPEANPMTEAEKREVNKLLQDVASEESRVLTTVEQVLADIAADLKGKSPLAEEVERLRDQASAGAARAKMSAAGEGINAPLVPVSLPSVAATVPAVSSAALATAPAIAATAPAVAPQPEPASQKKQEKEPAPAVAVPVALPVHESAPAASLPSIATTAPAPEQKPEPVPASTLLDAHPAARTLPCEQAPPMFPAQLGAGASAPSQSRMSPASVPARSPAAAATKPAPAAVSVPQVVAQLAELQKKMAEEPEAKKHAGLLGKLAGKVKESWTKAKVKLATAMHITKSAERRETQKKNIEAAVASQSQDKVPAEVLEKTLVMFNPHQTKPKGEKEAELITRFEQEMRTVKALLDKARAEADHKRRKEERHRRHQEEEAKKKREKEEQERKKREREREEEERRKRETQEREERKRKEREERDRKKREAEEEEAHKKKLEDPMVVKIKKLKAEAEARKDGSTVLHVAAQDPEAADVIAHLLKATDAAAADAAGAVDVNAVDSHGITPLHVAVQRSNRAAVRMLLEAKADVTACVTETGDTALHLAALRLHPKIVEDLLEFNVPLDVKNKKGDAAVHLAILKGAEAIAAMIIDAGADIRSRTAEGDSPLFVAIRRNKHDTVKRLLEKGSSVAETNDRGQIALHVAAECGNNPAAVLVASKENVNATDKAGNTPLHLAIKASSIDVVETLLKLGADVNAKNEAGETPTILACELDDIRILEMMADAGGDINATLKSGKSALYTAAWRGQLQAVALLCRRGAGVDQANLNGWSPLFVAATRGHREVASMLIEKYKAKINILSKQGTTPLYHSCEYGVFDVAKFLLEHGADPNLGSGDKGWKPIHVSVENPRITELLLAHGADVNAQVAAGKNYSPLHFAVSVKTPVPVVISMLLDHGASQSIVNENGQTALHLAVFRGQLEATKVLCEHPKNPADLKKKNAKGRTALDLAVFSGEKEIAEYLAAKAGIACPKIKEGHKIKVKSAEAPSAPPPPPDEKKRKKQKGK